MLLAGRDSPRLATAAAGLKWPARTLPFDATAVATHRELIDKAFAGGPVDLVISAAGVLIPQPVLDRDPLQAAALIETNLTGHVTTLLAAAARLRGQAAARSWCSPRSPRSGRAGPTTSTARPRPAWTRSPAGWPTRCTAAGSGCCWSGPAS